LRHPTNSFRRSWARTLTVLVLSVWLGGLVFYAGVVIPVGSGVVGGHRVFGFITRVVTPWLNRIGVMVLLVLLPQVWAGRRAAARRARSWSWSIMAAAQAALFVLHPWVDALLEPVGRRIMDADAFYLRHRVYLLVTTLQWCSGVVLLWAVLVLWSDLDET